MYSNYKEIVVEPEYITPNQIATQILYDSGIPHNSYFDYLYTLREGYPVIHKEFINVDGNPDLDLYRFIQYDIMFGNRWLVGIKQAFLIFPSLITLLSHMLSLPLTSILIHNQHLILLIGAGYEYLY